MTTAIVTSTVAAPAEPTKDEKCGGIAKNALRRSDDLSILYCDRQWIHAGPRGTDTLDVYYWDHNTWNLYAKDGFTQDSYYPCYSLKELVAAGAPERLTSTLTTCTSGTSSSDQYPAADEFSWAGSGVKCDGRYILIVESVLVAPGENLFEKPSEAQKGGLVPPLPTEVPAPPCVAR